MSGPIDEEITWHDLRRLTTPDEFWAWCRLRLASDECKRRQRYYVNRYPAPVLKSPRQYLEILRLDYWVNHHYHRDGDRRTRTGGPFASQIDMWEAFARIKTLSGWRALNIPTDEFKERAVLKEGGQRRYPDIYVLAQLKMLAANHIRDTYDLPLFSGGDERRRP